MRRKQHHITIIGQERPFDEGGWQQLLTAFAYVLHEQRQVAESDTANTTDEPATEHGNGTAHTARTLSPREDEEG